jgi:predicted GNAT superfamily acetyltransferase
MVIGWDLGSVPPAVGSLAPEPDPATAQVALTNDGDVPGRFRHPDGGTGAVALLGVPRDIEAIRREHPELGHRWRVRTREAFTELLDDGWAVRGFARTGHYVLHHERTP